MKKKGKKKYFPAHELFLEFTNKMTVCQKAINLDLRIALKYIFYMTLV